MTAFKPLMFTLLAATALGGCTTFSLEARHEAATKIASSAALHERVITAGLFNLTVWERAPMAGTPVDLYIEGDGLAWLDAHTKSLNPTPPSPLALQLAATDRAVNVIYLARPCQYTSWNGKGACPDLYWSHGRTAPEVIAAYQTALDNIKNTYHVSGFNLIGYSGGAAVAVLVAAERSDVLSLRTVAGNIDYTAFTTLHSISPMDASLNPVKAAPALTSLPQLHFIGGADTVVPAVIFNSWKQASGTSFCVQSVAVPDTSHEKGWVEKWPALLNTPLPCAAP
jgi:hypothetical protein